MRQLRMIEVSPRRFSLLLKYFQIDFIWNICLMSTCQTDTHNLIINDKLFELFASLKASIKMNLKSARKGKTSKYQAMPNLV